MTAVVTDFTENELIQVAFDLIFPKGMTIETGIPSRCFLATNYLGATFCLAPASVLPLLGCSCTMVAIAHGLEPWQLVPLPALDDWHFDGWDAMEETHGITPEDVHDEPDLEGMDKWRGYEIVMFPYKQTV
jgi:hypothetical protein